MATPSIQSTFPPAKILIRQPELCRMLDLSRNGLDLLRKKDPAFPRPIKGGETRQAPAYYVMEEVQQWLKARIEARDANLHTHRQPAQA